MRTTNHTKNTKKSKIFLEIPGFYFVWFVYFVVYKAILSTVAFGK